MAGRDDAESVGYRRYGMDGAHANSYAARERVLRAVTAALPESGRGGRARKVWKDPSRVPVKAVRGSIEAINDWKEIDLRAVEEERLPASEDVELSFRMEPFSVVLILLEPD